MKKFRGKEKAVVGIIAMMFITMGTVGISPALAQIAVAFPDKTTEQIQLLMSLPSFATIFSALCAPFIAEKLGKKNTVVLGLVIFLVTGLIPVFVSNWSIVVASRIGIGLGTGLVNCLNNVLIFDHFDDPEQQNTMLGWQQIGNDIGYIIMALAAGYLTLVSWQAAFAVHAVGILALVLTIVCLPKDTVQAPAEKKDAAAPAGKKHLTAGCVFWLIMVLVFECTLHTFSMNISFLVEETGAGDSVLAGYASTMMTVGGFVVALFYGKLSSVLKRWTLPFGILIDVIAMVVLYVMTASTPFLAVVGGTLIGAGMVIVFSTITAYAMRSVNPATQGLASAGFMICLNGGQFLNPYWASFLTKIFSDGSIQGKFLGAFIILAVVMVVAAFTSEKVGDKPQA